MQGDDLDSMTGIEHNKAIARKAVTHMRRATANWTGVGDSLGNGAPDGALPLTASGNAAHLRRPLVRIFQGDFTAAALTPGDTPLPRLALLDI